MTLEPERRSPAPREEAATSPSHGGRQSVLLLCCLLVMTLIGGLAARKIAESPSVTATPIGLASGFVRATNGLVHLSGRLDRDSVLQGGDGLVKLELVLGAESAPERLAPRLPTDLVVVLDRSGSMQGTPLREALAAVRELIAGMDPGDRFSLVTYSTGAAIAVPLSEATQEAQRVWLAELAQLRARGGTNMSGGLDLAAAIAKRERAAGRALRVILLSDGHANQGDHSLEGLRRRAARAVANEYVLSAVGVGSGFDEHLMSTLADAGTGNFYYVRGGESLAGVFAAEFAAARETVASSLEVMIETGPGVEVLDAAGYPLTRVDGVTRFRPGPLFSGQERRVWVTLRAPSGSVGPVRLGSVRLRYEGDGESRSIELSDEFSVACVAGAGEFYAGIDADAWAQSVMVDDYNALRQRVARFVRDGVPERAARAIGDYRSDKRALNLHLKRKDVEEQLRSLDELEQKVAAAAPGSAFANSLGKTLSAESLDGRRLGAKKQQRAAGKEKTQ